MIPAKLEQPHEGAMLVTYAVNQPDYVPLPASVDGDGCVMTEWEPTAIELAALMNGARVRIWLTGTDVQNGRPFTPMRVVTSFDTEDV